MRHGPSSVWVRNEGRRSSRSRAQRGARAPARCCSVRQRIERLSDEIADLQADRKDVIAEAKANGFDLKALREVLRRRKMEPHQLAELDCLVDVYERRCAACRAA
jgi:uncharacterized protein (UPF0335 family)